MTTGTADPPRITGVEVIDNSFNNNGIRFHLAYEYLPIRNIAVLIKTVDELYELIYFILNDEKVPEAYRLALDYAATGNSYDWWIKLIEAINPPKKVLIALAFTGAILSTPIEVESYRKSIEERHKIEAETELTRAQKKEILARIEQINAQTRSIDLDNRLREGKMSEDSIAKINKEANRKKIDRKINAINKVVTEKPITQLVINNTIIYNRDKE